MPVEGFVPIGIVTGMVLGILIQFGSGTWPTILGGGIGVILGWLGGNLLYILSGLHVARRMHSMSTEELRQALRDHAKLPNWILIELRQRGEDITQEMETIFTYLEADSYVVRRRGHRGLRVIFRPLSQVIPRTHLLSAPASRCWVAFLRSVDLVPADWCDEGYTWDPDPEALKKLEEDLRALDCRLNATENVRVSSLWCLLDIMRFLIERCRIWVDERRLVSLTEENRMLREQVNKLREEEGLEPLPERRHFKQIDKEIRRGGE